MKVKKLALALTGAGFVMIAGSQTNAACGDFKVAKGDVKIESGKSKTVSPIKEGTKVCSGDSVITGKDSRAKVVMEDGNELNISPNSKITLENYEYKPADNKKKVLLNVLQGKVRAATVKENMYNDKSTDGQANTFQVRTKSAVAGVRGTDFLTGFDPKSNKAEVVTFKGKVEVGQPGPGGKIMNPVQVSAGQKTEARVGQPPAPPKAVPAKELESMNTETKADTAGGKGGDNGSQGSGDAKKDDKEKKEEKKDGGGGSDDKKDSGDKDRKSDDKKSDGKSSGDKKNADSNGSGNSDGKDGKKESGGGDKQAGGDSQSGDKSSSSGDKKEGGERQPASNDAKSGPKQNGGGDSASSPAGASGGAGGSTGTAGGGNKSDGMSGGIGMGGGSSGGLGLGTAAPPPPPPPPPPMLTGPTIVLPPPPPPVPVIPKCEICDRTVQNNPSKVNIKIDFK